MKHSSLPAALIRCVLVLALVGVLVWGGLIGMVWWREKHIPKLDHYDCLVVLGAQVLPNGQPNVQLQLRLDAAYETWKKAPCMVVCCGGQGANEPAPEGAVMCRYLAEKGIPEDMLLADTESTTTLQNMRFAKKILEENRLSTRVCVITSDYHLPRALALAGDVGLTATGVGSEIKAEYWLKNHAREALAWVKYWAQKLTGRTGG